VTVGLNRLEAYRYCSFHHWLGFDWILLSLAADHSLGLGRCLTFHSSLSVSERKFRVALE
jgi:hypothetical protein